MPVVQPYGKKAIVKGYCREVVGIVEAHYDDALARADAEIESALRLDVGQHISDDYVYYKKVQNFCEQYAACLVHKMYGDPIDGTQFCMDAEKLKEEIKAEDPSLQTVDDTVNVEPQQSVTYPNNPNGMRLIGRAGSNVL